MRKSVVQGDDDKGRKSAGIRRLSCAIDREDKDRLVYTFTMAPFDERVEPVLVNARNGLALPRPTHFDPSVSRIQLEITVKVPGHRQHVRLPSPRLRSSPRSGSENDWTKTVDVAILSSQPTLRMAPGGAGDVLQQIDAADMAAATRGEGVPFVHVCQRGLYVADLLALLWMKREYGIDGHFMLLDRSHPLYGPWHREDAAMVWRNDHRQCIVFRRKGKDNFERNSLLGCG